jgi:hypothetical protein
MFQEPLDDAAGVLVASGGASSTLVGHYLANDELRSGWAHCNNELLQNVMSVPTARCLVHMTTHFLDERKALFITGRFQDALQVAASNWIAGELPDLTDASTSAMCAE